ncbi:DUF2313 domain-containing protein [Brevibacillus borstelensis]|jgi:hypothetical protein|uniref:DUF2313 domain-containing protein n=1 Tax=Brevibacillus borstelensis TaxID=45462 RepID=UPI0004F39E3B|nr:DUF2313 domain-containing protein [Brevibacillus borstelensis]KKX56335.1 hypothetical protein X546_04405 [Brevibacillus borstelensis cifa_chp40]MED1882397.1 DUF2313 domain-containing protein [Brevibacillus borstelensis]MED2006996.1 DUF2313 domain-containing protein [Brevibacillus borstelensis]RNB56677.1 DUF2313 domain-containing protein [Brevibacillus borstelensis]GED55835.1 hypothetical protein BBO01nite_50760 [Brevibacillus borstelensis]
MIPERYRRVLPPQWYENKAAEYHFEGASAAVDAYAEKRRDLEQQFFPLSATWGLDFWDWIYFGKKQSLSIEERRKNIQSQHWAYLGFTPSVLRAIGLSASKLKNVQMIEDFTAKVIHYVYQIEDWFDTRHAVQSVEKIRPVHCNGVSFEPVSGESLVFEDNVVVGIKEYHIVSEFRVGMAPIKRYEEVLV